MSSETIVIDYRDVTVVSEVNSPCEPGASSSPTVSVHDANIIPSVKIKKLDRDLYRSIKANKSKLIKQHEQARYNIREIKF